MIKKVGVALIGTGNIALMHVLGYKDFEDAEIVALCDLNTKRARKFREETKLPPSVKIYGSTEECFKDDNIDLVEILTPHATHEGPTIEAVEAGKHVSVQKPPAMTLSSYDRMVSAAQKAGVRFRVYENFRYHPPYVKALQLIKQGIIGDVLSVNIRMWMSVNAPGEYRGKKKRFPLHTLKWKIKEEHNYNAPTLFDDGYHKHSIIEEYLGDVGGHSVSAVRAWCGWEKIYGLVKMDSPAVVIYETKKANRYGIWNVNTGKNLPFHSSYFACDEHLEIMGSNGIIIAPGCTGNLFLGCECGGPGKPGVYWFSSEKENKDEQLIPETGEWKADHSMETDWSYSFINCTRHLATLIANDTWFEDDDPLPVLANQGRHIQAINLAIIRSLRNDGIQIKVKDIKDVP
ncbi:MAG: Gfo/Idh/MocA family protein [Promethearchaeota archaeon]